MKLGRRGAGRIKDDEPEADKEGLLGRPSIGVGGTVVAGVEAFERIFAGGKNGRSNDHECNRSKPNEWHPTH